MSALLFVAFAEARTVKKVEVPAPPPVVQVDPEAWRATRPGPAAAKDWSPPVPTELRLDNGIPVWLVESHDLPLVSVSLVMSVGREANPRGKAGLSALTANLLDEGTTRRDGPTLARTLAGLGAQLSTVGGNDRSVVALDALAGDRLGPALDLMAEVVLSPKFDKGVVERVRAEVVDGIKAEASQARAIAARALMAQLFGTDHAYGTPAVGSATSVAALKHTDLRSFHKDWWHAGNAAFVVAGDLSPDQARAELGARFGAWKAKKTTRPTLLAPATPLRTRVVFVEMPGAVQTQLMLGTPGPARTSPSFIAANFATTLFGGMFSSRLNMSLREEKGWSYGAYASLSESRDFGRLVASGSVQADQTAPAVQLIFDELKAAASREPSADEMKLTADYLLKSLPGSFETNAGTVDAFVNAHVTGLGGDAWRSFRTQTAALTPAASRGQAQALFDPARFVVVAAGPRSVEVDDGKGGKTTVDVVAGLRALGFEYVEWKM